MDIMEWNELKVQPQPLPGLYAQLFDASVNR